MTARRQAAQTRAVAATLAVLAVAPLALGASQAADSLRLALDGVAVMAEVVDRPVEDDRGGARYLLELRVPVGGGSRAAIVEVTEAEWRASDPGTSLPVTYARRDPGTFVVGAVGVPVGTYALLLVALALGVTAALSWRAS